MRALSSLLLPVIVVAIIAFGWALLQSAEENRAAMLSAAMTPDVELSPWDGLTGEEIASVARAVKARHGDGVIFNRISLRQPEKATALAWEKGQTSSREAEITFRVAGQSYITNFDIATMRQLSGKSGLAEIVDVTSLAHHSDLENILSEDPCI